MTMEEDPLLARLKELEPPRLDELKAERVRRRAQSALAESAQPSSLARAWSRIVMPAAVAATVGAYLFWAVSFSAALY